MFAMLLIGF